MITRTIRKWAIPPLLLVVLFLLLNASCVAGQDRDSDQLVMDLDGSTGDENEFGIDLNSLSKEELEKICTDRGFELLTDVIDEATGELVVLHHSDYIEAARQCLSIERDLDQILSENPEILEELEAEKTRILEEKEQLEKELDEASKKLNGNKTGTAFVTEPSKRSETETVEKEETVVESLSEHEEEIYGSDSINETRTDESQETSDMSIDKKEPYESITSKNTVKDRAIAVVEQQVQELIRAMDHLIFDHLPPDVAKVLRTTLVQIKETGIKFFHLQRRLLTALIKFAREEIAKRSDKSAEETEAASSAS